MKVELARSEEIAASGKALWDGLIASEILMKCIPGCNAMKEAGPDAYKVEMQLKVAAVRGSFDGTGQPRRQE